MSDAIPDLRLAVSLFINFRTKAECLDGTGLLPMLNSDVGSFYVNTESKFYEIRDDTLYHELVKNVNFSYGNNFMMNAQAGDNLAQCENYNVVESEKSLFHLLKNSTSTFTSQVYREELLNYDYLCYLQKSLKLSYLATRGSDLDYLTSADKNYLKSGVYFDLMHNEFKDDDLDSAVGAFRVRGQDSRKGITPNFNKFTKLLDYKFTAMKVYSSLTAHNSFSKKNGVTFDIHTERNIFENWEYKTSGLFYDNFYKRDGDFVAGQALEKGSFDLSEEDDEFDIISTEDVLIYINNKGPASTKSEG